MARVEFHMPDDFLSKVASLGEHIDEIIPRVLEAGGEVALNAVRNGLHASLSGESSGELARALGLSPAKMDQDGNYNVKVGFDEPRRDGSSNAMVANIIEYGKHGQPPHPFLKPAKSAARAPAIAAMKNKLEDELRGL